MSGHVANWSTELLWGKSGMWVPLICRRTRMKFDIFLSDRTEHEKERYKYYVPPIKLEKINRSRPILLMGTRGSGKTIIMLCNSWRDQYKAWVSGEKGSSLGEMIRHHSEIGLYYKVIPSFAKALNRYGDKLLFNTYLSIKILEELFSLLKELHNQKLLDASEIDEMSKKYYQSARNLEDTASGIDDLLRDTEKAIFEIEDILNMNGDVDYEYPALRKTLPGTILLSVIKSIKQIEMFKDVVFKIYIDEFEGLEKWQQQSVNALVKLSDENVIYNIGVRTAGMWTYSTEQESEELQYPRDCECIDLDLDIDSDEYLRHLKNIAKKRLEMYNNISGSSPINTDISHYLGNYNPDFELELINNIATKKRDETQDYKCKHQQMLEKEISKKVKDQIACEKYIKALSETPPILNSRIHLTLLCQGQEVKVEELYDSYKEYEEKTNSTICKKYDNWVHNRKVGAIFLLAQELEVNKLYYGFDTFARLSFGSVGTFMELCSRAFNEATEGTSIGELSSASEQEMGDPPISSKIQTDVAAYVSYKHFEQIREYEHGMRLTMFAHALGSIFRGDHYGLKNALSQPERNHFWFKEGLSDKAEYMMGRAEYHNVIRRRKPSKVRKIYEKENIYDCYLNRTLAPHFIISCSNKHKLELSTETIEVLLTGLTNDVNSERDRILKNIAATNNLSEDQKTLLKYVGESDDL